MNEEEFEQRLIGQAGLTEGESKVYLALLEIGNSTIGPIIEKSKVARSFAYNILNSLIEKGLVSYTVKEKVKTYQAAEPSRILDYIEKKKQQLDEDKKNIEKILPKLKMLQEAAPKTSVAVFEGFRGVQTAFEHHEDQVKKGEEYLCFGGYPTQKNIYHNYWMKHHVERAKKGVKTRMLFDRDVSEEIMKNRNSYKLCDTRKFHKKLKLPAWFLIYKDTTTIFLEATPDFKNTEDLAIEIVNKEIADTFRTLFEDYWQQTKKNNK
ncbi:MAG: TrmB family transcriptional regulator [Candidatus Nanoarchaeia archaeon]